MLALRIRDQELAVADVPVPEPEGEALVRVIKSGVCGTDLELVKGYSGFLGTPGHEFVGLIETSGGRPDLTGKRVVGEINAGCRLCEWCLSNDPRHCPNRTVLGIVGRDGAHAEFLTLPAGNLHVVPDRISDEEAVFVEPLAAAVEIGERFDFSSVTDVAVIGDGKLGILCARALAAKYRGLCLRLVGRNESKLNLAASTAIETMHSGQIDKLRGHFDVIVEASGSASGFDSALELVRPRGTIILKSTYHGPAGWDASRIVVNELTIMGSRCGRFGPAIDLLASNQIQVADLISEEFPLSKGVAAFHRAGAKGVLKVLIDMGRN